MNPTHCTIRCTECYSSIICQPCSSSLPIENNESHTISRVWRASSRGCWSSSSLWSGFIPWNSFRESMPRMEARMSPVILALLGFPFHVCNGSRKSRDQRLLYRHDVWAKHSTLQPARRSLQGDSISSIKYWALQALRSRLKSIWSKSLYLSFQ